MIWKLNLCLHSNIVSLFLCKSNFKSLKLTSKTLLAFFYRLFLLYLSLLHDKATLISGAWLTLVNEVRILLIYGGAVTFILLEKSGTLRFICRLENSWNREMITWAFVFHIAIWLSNFIYQNWDSYFGLTIMSGFVIFDYHFTFWVFSFL